MFETSFVRERVAPRRRAGFFIASIVAHTVAVAGIVVATATATSLPTKAPDEISRFVVFDPPADNVPLPKGNPNAPREPQQQQQAPTQHAQQTAPAETVTPNVIPDAPATSITPSTLDAGPSTGPNTGTNERWGVKDGDEHGIDIGQSQSVGTGIPDAIYRPGAVDVKAATVLYRVQPAYPPVAMRTKMPGWVILKCIVGKTGEIRDIEVVKGSLGIFEQPAIEALRQWKFAPGYFRGQAVDTYFELRITFEVR